MITDAAPVALITGAARRIGAALARVLHAAGYRVALHYHRSATAAQALCNEFNQHTAHSAYLLCADLTDIPAVRNMAASTLAHWGRVDVLINNASTFYPTPLAQADEQQWQDLLGSNLQGPYFLCQALADSLTAQRGVIINIADIYAFQPLANHSIYCIAKAGNTMLTKSLARDLAPHVRVNGIAPGAILWPENTAQLSPQASANILATVPLGHLGSVDDIAQTALFLIEGATYMTGQIIAVDGGKHLS